MNEDDSQGPDDAPEHQSPPPTAPDTPLPATWEDDENATTLFLRAVFTFFAGGLLLWAQWHAPLLPPGQNWNRWIANSVISNFVLPLGIVWLFFGQGLSHPEWLRDARYNAWGYGWNWRPLRAHLKVALLGFLILLPFLWWQSRDPIARDYYQNQYFPPLGDARSLLLLLASLVLYMFCWEWFFRGFLLFGMAQGVGPIVAIVVQGLMFGAAHSGKPTPEVVGAFAGGIVLGAVAWKYKSFAPAFYVHALVHGAWAILVSF